MMEDTSNSDDVSNRDESRCFVCDAKVQGRYYALATCKTQNSRSRVIEKLGELVGERYMVVISEDDVICRSCASLINTLDRLEMEMRNVRDHILRFLEQKYSLEEGELLGNGDRPRLCQPPQITKCNTKDLVSYCAKDSKIDHEVDSNSRRQQRRSRSWLQCDKCKYTTHLNSFVMHHMRNHIEQKAFCKKCGLCTSDHQEEVSHNCSRSNNSENRENEGDNPAIIASNDSIETSLMYKMTRQLLPTQTTETTPPPLIGLSNCDHLYVSNMLSAEIGLSAPSKQRMYTLQPIGVDDVDGTNEKIRILEKT